MNMKGRFTRIFELWNNRNTEYYKESFERLEKENKTTFNFAAAFFPITWMMFRKMYGWAVLLVLVTSGIHGVLPALCQNREERIISLVVFWLVLFIVFGSWGNTLYYKNIKSKIAKGYAEITNYNPIDPIGGIVIIGVIISILKWIISGILIAAKVSSSADDCVSPSLYVFFIAILWAINYKKCHAQESAEPVEVTEESVNKYLERANPKRLTVSLGVATVAYLISFLLLLSMMSVFAVAGMKATGDKIKQQLDKIAEEVDKTPNNSKKSVKIRTDNKTRKQLDETGKTNKRIIEKQKS